MIMLNEYMYEYLYSKKICDEVVNMSRLHNIQILMKSIFHCLPNHQFHVDAIYTDNSISDGTCGLQMV